MAPVLARPGPNFSPARWRFGDKIQSPQASPGTPLLGDRVGLKPLFASSSPIPRETPEPTGTLQGSFEKWLESLRDTMAARAGWGGWSPIGGVWASFSADSPLF